MSGEYLVPNIQPFGVICRINAEQCPDKIAIADGGHTISWRDFYTHVTQVANGLTGYGVKPGEHVVVLGRNNPGMFETLHACAFVGAVFTPVNWRLAPAEIEYILNDCHVQVLFVSQAMWDVLKPVRDNLKTLKRVVVFEEGAADGLPPFVSWRDAQSRSPVEMPVDPEAPVIQIYTSGTTGRPKGAMLAHRYFISMAKFFRDQDNDVFDLKDGESILHYMPIFHISGASHAYYPTLRCGGIIVLQDFEAGEVLRVMSKYKVPLLTGVPSMLQLLINHPDMAHTDLTHVRHCLYGGAAMPIPLRDRLMELVGCRFTQIYGMTESNYVTRLSPDDHLGEATKALSVGRPAPGVELRIFDPDGNALPPGQVGEIALRSPSIVKGYWNLPEATTRAFRGGWYLTGDGGYVDEDGYLFLKDRIKDMIISGGENIYPAEIEHVLVRHPSVMVVAVVGIPDKRWGEAPKAFIQLKPGHTFSAQDLHAFASQNLGRFKLPKYYEAVTEFPMTGSGKIQKYELRKRSNENAVKV